MNTVQIKRGAEIPTIDILRPYELGFCTSDKLVYINPGDNVECIPIGCVPTNMSWINGESNGPTLILEGKGIDSLTATIPIANEYNSGVINIEQQSFSGLKHFKDGILFQLGENDNGMKLAKKENGNLTLSLYK